MNSAEMNNPPKIIRTNISRDTMLAFRGVGLFFIKELRIGSKLSVKAGGPSIIKFTHNSSSAVNGVGNPALIDAKTTTTDDRLTVSWNRMNR